MRHVKCSDFPSKCSFGRCAPRTKSPFRPQGSWLKQSFDKIIATKMAFNVQIPSNSGFRHESWVDQQFFRRIMGRGTRSTSHFSSPISRASNKSMYSFAQKMGSLTPSLCFQRDVFFPNAIAAVKAAGDNLDHYVQHGGHVVATGCRGNQIQRDFPLQSRVPVAIPLVQYPSPTSELFLDQLDICAAPVLHWEKYMESVKISLAHTRFRDKPSQKYRPLTNCARKRKKMERWKRKCQGLLEESRPLLEDIRTSSSEDEEVVTNQNEASVSGLSASVADSHKIKYKKIGKRKALTNETKKGTLAESKKILFDDEYRSKIAKGQSSDGKNALKLEFVKKCRLRLDKKTKKNKEYTTLNKLKLTGIKNIPKFRLESTWNYAYGGASGACCVITKHNICQKIFVGKGTQVRQIVLEKSVPSSMLSYRVQSVWEEAISDVPTNTKYGSRNSDPMNNLVFQILTPVGNSDLLGVRRGRSVDIYSIEEESPYLLDSIPNVCYGTRKYAGWEGNKGVEDPLLLGMDFNPLYAAEFITIDENVQLRICDLSKATTVQTYSISKPTRPGPDWFEFPKFRYINDASGVQFAHQGQIFYAWTDSKVLLGDRRSNFRARAPLIDTFDLRRSVTSLSWSDQMFFNDSSIALNEYICSLKLSKKENYYYVGTTSRIFLLDARVPGQPVLKFEHGTPAAAYLDTYTNDSFEVLVSGSQRLGSTICAITDHAHVKCFDRPDCTAINPVLHCLPQHLSSSQHFFDTVSSTGFDLTWEAEHQRAKSHNYAWTTGLAVTKMDCIQDPHEPGGILVFTSNCYGDVFYQELAQNTIERHKKTELSDFRFTEFAKSWQSSMKSVVKSDFLKPSLNPFNRIDYSMLIEPSAHGIQRMTNVRHEPFDAKKPDELELAHQFVKENEIPFHTRLQKLRKYKADIAQRCLDFWEYESSDDEVDPAVVIKEELESEFNSRYGNEWNKDGTRDVEYLCNQQKRLHIVDLDSQRNADMTIPSSTSTIVEPMNEKKRRGSSLSSSNEELEMPNEANEVEDACDNASSTIDDDYKDGQQLIEFSSSDVNMPTSNIAPSDMTEEDKSYLSSCNDDRDYYNFAPQLHNFASTSQVSDPSDFFELSQLHNLDEYQETELQFALSPEEKDIIPSSQPLTKTQGEPAARKSKSGF